MQLFLRPLSRVERISRISDKQTILTEKGVEASLLIEPGDSRAMIYRLVIATLKEKFTNQQSILEAGGDVFFTICTPGFYKHAWWNSLSENIKSDTNPGLIFGIAFSWFDSNEAEMKAASEKNNYPPVTEELLKAYRIYYLFWSRLDQEITGRTNYKSKLLFNEPAFSELYDYRVSYKNNEVICVKSKQS
ncbi:MAG: hypothetical protein POELPBGB_02052 [Bacteroidia bacterium]|nr:hypothetical protein [Bacteroidia bacterium]